MRRLLFALALLGVVPVAAADQPPVRSIEVGGEGSGVAEMTIDGSFDVPTYAVRTRKGGKVVVIEVAGASLPEGGVRARGRTPLVARTVASSTARGVRIEVVLARTATYRARSEDGRIVVRFEALDDEEEARSEPEPDSEPQPEADGPVVVRAAHVERRDGRDRVVLELNRAAPFRIPDNETEGVARMKIPGARLAKGADRKVRGKKDSTVRAVELSRASDGVVVEVDRAVAARGTAIREGHRIVWLFSPSDGGSKRPRTRTIAREEGYETESADTAETAGFLSDVPLQVAGARSNRRYSGRRIDLDFKDADIHNILRLLAEVGGVNVVTGDDVQGAVTIRMRNVPWDQALDVILQAKGLGMVRRGNLIRVAPLETLEKEREAAIARRKQQQELAPLETRLVPVSYAEAQKLVPQVKDMLTGRGTVSIDERTNVLIVRDVSESLNDVESLVRTLDTQTPQVLIEARIVEATSEYNRDVGIQWGGDVAFSSATGNPTGLAFPNDVGMAGGASGNNPPTQGLSPFSNTVDVPNYAVNLPAVVQTGQGGALGLSLGSVGGNINLNVRLSAAESSGTVRIISSPRILTLDNHEAHIAQGTLIPYSQVSAQGVNTAFQEAKLELQVRPHVTADGSVTMHAKITRDEPDFTRTSQRGDPTILKREAETDLLIEDGHTAVIGGIYTRNTGRSLDQVPFFGDIPILGVLFQRRRVTDDRNELLIFLTPRIVNRAESLPGQ
ncbi:MAG: type IV pilus secretin PilQ [Myxococcota bacterium]